MDTDETAGGAGEERARNAVRPWTFSHRDNTGNCISLTVIPTPDGVIRSAVSYRDTGYQASGIAIGNALLGVEEGTVEQSGALAALGYSRVSQLDGVEVSVAP